MILNMLQPKLIKQIVVLIIIKNSLRPPLPTLLLHLHIQTNLGSHFKLCIVYILYALCIGNNSEYIIIVCIYCI